MVLEVRSNPLFVYLEVQKFILGHRRPLCFGISHLTPLRPSVQIVDDGQIEGVRSQERRQNFIPPFYRRFVDELVILR